MRKILNCIFILLLVPVLINFIVGTKNIFPLPLVGTPSAWLVFWGSYVGSLISAAIAIIVLWRTREYNHKEFVLQDKRRLYREFRNSIASRIGKLENSGIINLKNASTLSNDSIREEMWRLQQYRAQLYSDVFSSTIKFVYGDNSDEEIRFVYLYTEHIRCTVKLVEDMITQYSKYVNMDQDKNEVLKGIIFEFCKQMEELQKKVPRIHEAAEAYLDHIQSEYKKDLKSDGLRYHAF